MKYQIANLSSGPFGDIFDNLEDVEAALEMAAQWDKDVKQDVAPASTPRLACQYHKQQASLKLSK